MSKKSSKPFLLFGLVMCMLATGIILAYVGIKLKCEEMVKEKILAEEELLSKRNYRTALTAQHQNYNSEERIVFWAAELGMIKQKDASMKLKVSKSKIEKISKVIKEKYE